ncbi:MAG: small multi-drug export protein [Oscillibacter sp.]|nr:small multi-drug export protein [Oscillibacter sp.]
MVPVLELRGGIPFGVGIGLHPLKAWAACVAGNMLPIPLIIVYIRQIFKWLRATFPRLGNFIDRLEHKAHLKGRVVLKYRYLGLFLFVAVPLPGTGGWTGALVAAFLNMRLKNALASIFSGLAVAGFIVTLLTSSVSAVLG